MIVNDTNFVLIIVYADNGNNNNNYDNNFHFKKTLQTRDNTN